MTTHTTPSATSGSAWLQERFGLEGRTAVVTGGTRGIGLMIARGLLQAGAKVIICSRKQEAVDAAVAELQGFGEAQGWAADLSTEEGCRTFAAEVESRTDSLNILVNNAGATWGEPFESYPASAWDKVLNLNLKTPFLLTQSLTPLLERSASSTMGSRIINIGSIDGLQVPASTAYAYAASKAGVHHLTRMLAKELASKRINVNAIAPGPFPSKMMAFVLDEHSDRVAGTSPLNRIGEPNDIAAAAVFLASEASSYVTGAVLEVDGGIATTMSANWAEDS